MHQRLHITKLDAARRQLETAIRLYFAEADPVSIHTLAAAAYNIIRDLNVARGGKPMFAKRSDIWKPQHVGLIRRKLNEAENFFKHAERDPEATFAFKPEFTEFFLLDASLKYYEITSEVLPLFNLFVTWFSLNHPNLFHLTKEEVESQKTFSASKPSRATFFRHTLPNMSKLD